MSKVLRFDQDGNAVWIDKSLARRPAPGAPKETVSDTLGCIPQQVEDFRRDALAHGFKGVEFVPDPTCPQDFYQVRFPGGERERQKYMKHRGYEDHNSRNGSGTLGVEGLRAAEELAKRACGDLNERRVN